MDPRLLMGVVVWIASRLVAAVLVTLAVSSLSVVMIRLADPGAFGPPQPVPQVVWDFLEGLVLHLDLGRSIDFRNNFRPVADLVRDGILPDLALFGGAFAIGLLAGLAGGVIAARNPRGFADRLLGGASLLVLSAPVYWLGLMLIIVLGRRQGEWAELAIVAPGTYVPFLEDPLRWLQALAVPWCLAGAPLAAVVLRLTRSALAETQGEDYVRTARGKGLRRRRVDVRHALPPALPSPVALAGSYAPLLVGNALLVGQVFNVPGAFRLFPRAIDQGDYPVIQGLVVLGALLVALANLAADLVLAGLDPRTRPWAAK